MNVGKWGKQKQSELMKTYQKDPTKQQVNGSHMEQSSKMESKADSRVKEMEKKTESGVSKWNKNKSGKSSDTAQNESQGQHPHYMDPIQHVKPEHFNKIDKAE